MKTKLLFQKILMKDKIYLLILLLSLNLVQCGIAQKAYAKRSNDFVWKFTEEIESSKESASTPFWQTDVFRFILLISITAASFLIYRWRLHAKGLAEEKKFDAALVKQRNLLRTLIDNLPDAIYVKDIKCRKVISNLADVHNMHLKSEEEVVGKDDFELFPKELAEGFFKDDQMVLQTGQPVINREEYVLNEKGEKRWLSTSKLPLRDQDNKIIGLVGIGRDITDRKNSEVEKESLIKELQNALTDIKTLTGLLPICASCKKIRDDQGYWTQLESFIQDHSDTRFSHSICPECAAKLYPNYKIKKS